MKMFSSRRESALAVSLVFCFLLQYASALAPWELPPTCTRLKCAPYVATHTEIEHEIRSYKPSVWLTSNKIHSLHSQRAAIQGKMPLIKYLCRSKGEKLDLVETSPMLMDVLPNDTYQVFYYLPEKYQKNVPTVSPTDDIKLVTLPRSKYAAVKRFSGLHTQEKIMQVADNLKKSLQGTPYQKAAASELVSIAVYKNAPNCSEVLLWYDSEPEQPPSLA